MRPAFRTVALIGRYKSRGVAEPLIAAGRHLESLGCKVLMDDETAQASGVNRFGAVDYDAMGAHADLAIVLGGDGSMLSAARALARHRIPLVGVNQGRLGFMTDVSLRSMKRSIKAVIAGNYTAEARTMLSASVLRGRKTIATALALNDVVVSKGATGRLIELVVHIDGQFVYDLRSDGLITATPTGSTAYALSSNGPILHPGMAAFVLVPISPHTLSNRPIALPDRATVEIKIEHGSDARLHFDGQLNGELREGDRVRIRRARWSVRFIHPPGYDYFAMLRGKLHWTENPL